MLSAAVEGAAWARLAKETGVIYLSGFKRGYDDLTRFLGHSDCAFADS